MSCDLNNLGVYALDYKNETVQPDYTTSISGLNENIHASLKPQEVLDGSYNDTCALFRYRAVRYLLVEPRRINSDTRVYMINEPWLTSSEQGAFITIMFLYAIAYLIISSRKMIPKLYGKLTGQQPA